MKHRIVEQINHLGQELTAQQEKSGVWNFCFENNTFADAYLIILIRILNIQDEQLIRTLVTRLKSEQTQDGTWKLYMDEGKGNLSATIEAYYALLFSGYVNPNDVQMRKAKKFIHEQGGLSSASPYTKVMLAITGQYPWPENLKVPMELLLLPPFIPFNIYDFVGYARVHFVPIMVCVNKKFSIKTDSIPDLSDLYFPTNHRNRAMLDNELPPIVIDVIKEIREIIRNPRSLAYKRAEEFMLQRIEKDGTLYNYFSATILMIFALLALDYPKDSPVIKKAIKGLQGFACNSGSSITIQNSPSNIWDTALISYALQEAGVPRTNPMIQKATSFLLSKQQKKYSDWYLHNPGVLPGGWGFSDNNTLNPDIDDTTAALRAIQSSTAQPPVFAAWNKGVNWLLSMQNHDGGWPAFEKNTDKKYTKLLPIQGVDTVTTDPSAADLTGRTLEFLGNFVHLKQNHPSVQRGVRWLLNHQEKDGSWYGRWGISYIYGTWAAITGLIAVGVPKNHPSIQKAAQWLTKIQNYDGGWGESCKSDHDKHYIALQASTPSQTAWALDALIAIHNQPTPALQKGMEALLKLIDEEDWRTIYPTGAGFPGNFYVHYHSYRYIWPLVTIGHYQKKFNRSV